MASAFDRLRSWARRMKREIIALWIAARDSRTPLTAKLMAAAVAAYALSPVDLIPDFIPILGYVDDLLIVPLGITLAVRLIPQPLMAEFRILATQRSHPPHGFAAAAVIILLWLALLSILGFWLVRRTG